MKDFRSERTHNRIGTVLQHWPYRLHIAGGATTKEANIMSGLPLGRPAVIP